VFVKKAKIIDSPEGRFSQTAPHMSLLSIHGDIKIIPNQSDI